MASETLDLLIILAFIVLMVLIIYVVWPKRRRYDHVEEIEEGHCHE